LLSVLKVKLIGKEEKKPKGRLCHELHVFVVEKDVVVVKEQEL
jgi:hypothetical protein